MTFGKTCNNLTLPYNGTYGTLNILGSITGGGSGMDLADNDPTLFQKSIPEPNYRDWETDRKSTRLNSSHRSLSRMPSSA